MTQSHHSVGNFINNSMRKSFIHYEDIFVYFCMFVNVNCTVMYDIVLTSCVYTCNPHAHPYSLSKTQSLT